MGQVAELERARQAYADRAWAEARAGFDAGEAIGPLKASDLELLATAAYMLGLADEHLSVLERAHEKHSREGNTGAALRCAFWVGLHLAAAGEVGRAGGWLARVQRQVDRQGDCAERGYLLLPKALRQAGEGDLSGAAASCAQAAAIGERFDEPDLVALARQEEGNCLILAGRLEPGITLLDEAMIAVGAGELSPIVTGLVYCGVIEGCHEAYELRRAQEWTEALTQWCDQQPEIVAFTGRCLVHRAEIMQLHGAWESALTEARQAQERRGMSDAGAGHAIYRQAEVLRLQGDFGPAELAYREAARLGREAQPGLSLLRLAQRRADAASAGISRALEETMEPSRRAALLPAHVEIMLAVDEIDAARRSAEELTQIAAGFRGSSLDATAAHARGAVELAEGDARAALVDLRRAAQGWQELSAPYEAAKARILIGIACQTLGDDEAADLERDVARAAFAELGAAPDLARTQHAGQRDSAGLTQRELEVLECVAAGETNRAIAAELVVSERTIDRHVSNIFVKLGVSSRAAATAQAYRRGLV